MGNTLDKPITEKETDSSYFRALQKQERKNQVCDDDDDDDDNNNETTAAVSSNDDDDSDNQNNHQDVITWGVSSMQGWRVHMEDAHICQEIYQITIPSTTSSSERTQEKNNKDLQHLQHQQKQQEVYSLNQPHYFFVVLDGHGGTFASRYVSTYLYSILCQQSTFRTYVRKVSTVLQNDQIDRVDDDNDDNDEDTNNARDNNEQVGKSKKQIRKEKQMMKKKRKEKQKKMKGMKKNTRKNDDQNDSNDDDWIDLQQTLLQRALEDTFIEMDYQLLEEVIRKYGLSNHSNRKEKKKNDKTTHDDDDDDGDDWEIDLTETEPLPSENNHDESTQQQQQHENNDESTSGTTVTAVLITPDLCLCANTGDSRAILIDDFSLHAGGFTTSTENAMMTTTTTTMEGTDDNNNNHDNSTMPVVVLSRDHKPTNDGANADEIQRIVAAGGNTNFERVDGELAVSRALGDFEFKDYPPVPVPVPVPNDNDDDKDDDETAIIEKKRTIAQHLKVSPFPEVIVHPRSDGDEMLIIACDGIWDVLSNSVCASLVMDAYRRMMSQPKTSMTTTTTTAASSNVNLGLLCEQMLDICLEKGSQDNMTLLVAKFPTKYN